MAMAHNPETKVKHSWECKRVFGVLDPMCPRCVELASGAKPRTGWAKRPVYRPSEWHCFCPSTSLAANRCPSCGKPPYTD